MATYFEVTEALKFFVELGGAFQVDENGYIRFRGQDKVAQVSTKNENKDLILLQEVINDNKAQILNPFAEGLGASPDQNWFYETFEGAFTYRFVEVLKFIVHTIASNDGNLEDAKLPGKVIKLISPYVKVVDKTTIKELDQITKNFNKFSSLFYNKRLKTATFRCAIFEGPAFRESFSVRKKTWKFFENILIDLFGLDKDQDFDNIFESYRYKTEVIGYPKLDAMLNLYYKLFNQLNPVFDLVDQVQGNNPEIFSMVVDLDTFGHHLARLDEYFQKAKTIIQPTVTQPSQSSVRQSVPNTTQTGGLPTPSPHNMPGQNYGDMPLPNNSNLGNLPMPGNYNPSGMPQSGMPGQMPQQYGQQYGQMPQGGGYNYPQPPNQVPIAQAPGQQPMIPNQQPMGGMPSNSPGIPMNAPGIPNTGGNNYGPIGGMPNANLQVNGQPTRSGYAAPTLSVAPPMIG